MKNKDLITVFHTLSILKGHTGHKFGMFVAKNLQVLKPEVMIIAEEQQRIGALLNEYRKKQKDLIMRLSTEGEDLDIAAKVSREAITMTYSFPKENTGKFASEMKVLEAEYKDAIDETEKEEAELRKTMEAENENYKPLKINSESLPKTLTVEVYSALIDLILISDEDTNTKE